MTVWTLPGWMRAMARGTLPLANASQAAPCAGRALWHIMYTCGACGGAHFGRSRDPITTGKRTARCGRTVFLVVRRTHGTST
jgi:hypothetical protein